MKRGEFFNRILAGLALAPVAGRVILEATERIKTPFVETPFVEPTPVPYQFVNIDIGHGAKKPSGAYYVGCDHLHEGTVVVCNEHGQIPVNLTKEGGPYKTYVVRNGKLEPFEFTVTDDAKAAIRAGGWPEDMKPKTYEI